MTATAPTSSDVTSQPGEHEVCDVCDHALADHDAIGLRYCRATRTNAITRDCICHTS